MAAPYLHIVHTQVRFGEADSWVHQGFSIALDSVAETLFVRCFTQPVWLPCTLSGSLAHYPSLSDQRGMSSEVAAAGCKDCCSACLVVQKYAYAATH